LALQTLIIVATLSLLGHVRAWAIDEMASPRGRQQWNAWREAVRKQAGGHGPVQRRVPSSDEPPVVLLLRDHFAQSTAAVTIFLSLIVWLTIGALWGIFRAGPPPPARRAPPRLEPHANG